MILLLDVLLLSRLLFLPPDRSLTFRRLICLVLFQLIGFLMFESSIAQAAGLIISSLIALWIFIKDRDASRDMINRNRVISLIFLVLLINVLFSREVNIQPGVISLFLYGIAENLLSMIPHTPENLQKLGVYLAGLFFVIGESNYFVRWMLGKLHLAVSNGTVDEKEFNAGRIIGIIERLLIYQFMLLGAHAAIGFVLAAKGFTRYRELDERNFAEYVLVGTLLSTACAVFVALAVDLI